MLDPGVVGEGRLGGNPSECEGRRGVCVFRLRCRRRVTVEIRPLGPGGGMVGQGENPFFLLFGVTFGDPSQSYR